MCENLKIVNLKKKNQFLPIVLNIIENNKLFSYFHPTLL